MDQDVFAGVLERVKGAFIGISESSDQYDKGETTLLYVDEALTGGLSMIICVGRLGNESSFQRLS